MAASWFLAAIFSAQSSIVLCHEIILSHIYIKHKLLSILETDISLLTPCRSHYEEAEQAYVPGTAQRDLDMHFHIKLVLVISSCQGNGFHPSSLGIQNHTMLTVLEQGLQFYQQHSERNVRESAFLLRGSLFLCTIFLRVYVYHNLDAWVVVAAPVAKWRR